MADLKEKARDVFMALFVLQIFYTPIFILFIFGLLLLTPFWFITVGYFIWLFVDRNTPKRGGRYIPAVVKLPIWEFLRGYFPLEVIRTEELSPDRNYMFGVHPHGIYNLTFFLEALYHNTTFANLFPGIKIKPLALDSALSLPLHREFLLSVGFTSISRQGFEYWFKKHSKGIALKFSIGGLEEMLDTKPNTMTLNLSRKKGFCKLALKHGVSLVPVYQFGENELFKSATQFNGIQKFLIKNFGIYFPICSGRWLNMPFKKPIYTVVGSPIYVDKVENPSNEQVDELHEKYIEGVRNLFEKYNEKYGSKEATLKIK